MWFDMFDDKAFMQVVDPNFDCEDGSKVLYYERGSVNGTVACIADGCGVCWGWETRKDGCTYEQKYGYDDMVKATLDFLLEIQRMGWE